MGRGLTVAQKTEIAKAALKTRTLITISLDSGPFRILANDSIANIVINSNTYYARMMQTSGIETSLDGTTDTMSISVSDIAQEFAALVATNGDVLTNRGCKVEEVIFDGNTTTIIGDPVLLFDGKINKIQLTAKTFVFTVERILNNYSSLSPNMIFDVNCQWRFKDSRCTYAGAETKCDKTMTRCKVLSNVTNFGGYPSVIIPTPTE
ncbi:MAG: hypothetical protein A2Y25_02070 [Candidatus Melainabacteria bacterium GWF2_37_15]|nr:MAG: hypothetical protein A2Y25_02070 [Candidatus Melainabacteria bacterium GWF2_37_15]